MMTDPVADMLTRIRNAHAIRMRKVAMPASTLRLAIAKVLEEEGYIAGFEAPPGKQMGHAGAIVKEGGPSGESAAEKKEILGGMGIPVAMNPSEAAQLMIQKLS